MFRQSRFWTGLAAGVLACQLPSFVMAAEQQVVKVGLTGPLSGPQAAIGKDNENGLRMAIDQLNAQGVVVNGKAVRFSLVSEDDAADPRTGMSVAQRLVDGEVKVVFGPFNSGVAIPISRLLDQAGIVMATVASNPAITQSGYTYIFRISANDSQLGKRMGEFASAKLRARRFAVIDDRTAYGQGVADEFVKAARAEGIEIVAREFTSDKAVDFVPILTRIRGMKVDGIFYGGYYSQAGPLRSQMKRLAMTNAYLLGGDAMCNIELARLGGDAVDEHVYCPQGGPVLENTGPGRQFKTDYRKRYNTDPLTYSASLYDGLRLVAQAMKAANSVEPAQYRAALAGIDMQGVAGRYRFDPSRDLRDSPITIYTYRNGAQVPLPQDR